MKDYRKTWENYTSIWRSKSLNDRLSSFKDSVSDECIYADPLVEVKGWDHISEYIETFQKQFPDCYFKTVDFFVNKNKSTCSWQMISQDDQVVGHGISYAEYENSGKLIKIAGFFDVPEQK